MTDHRPIARLALEDGTVFQGQAFGHLDPRNIEGEVCFNTSLSGYQEILTDPSYAGQIVTMTYPLIGNYGVNEADLESTKIWVQGFVVRELAHRVSNYRSESKLEDWLAGQQKTGITGIDTRALTRKLRITGAMRGILSTMPVDQASDADLVKAALASPEMTGQNYVKVVSRRDSAQWNEDLGLWEPIQGEIAKPGKARKVVAIDCGIKHNILRNLRATGCDLVVVPNDTSAEAILEHKPDGVFVSNGPGDPAAVDDTVAVLKDLRGKAPIFGICLGHQLLSRALGAKTFKLKFGHRGGNQPVQNLHTGKVEITSQNHGFAVDSDTLEKVGGEPTHINLNDRTLEGFRHGDDAIFAVQYHPEASPGPHDARYLFDCFMTMMATGKAPTGQDMDNAQRQRNKVGEKEAS